MTTINFWPILVSSIVAFGLSALWYSPFLFGKEWMSLQNMNEKDINKAKAKGMAKLYIIQFITTLVSFTVLAFVISSLNANGQDGAMIGLIAWIGFILPISVSSFLWENKPLRLIAINSISILVTLVIGGAIIGAWN
ncbi:MAG: DUF1761 domain-containing protein [bacterium]|nr:DUF1761 domain-containing protein [bacterium]